MEVILKSFIVQEMLALLPVLWLIGAIIKRTPIIQNWIIPYIILIIGIAGGGFIVGWTTQGILQGIYCAGVAVLAHQLVKQGTDKYKEWIVNNY